MRPPVGVFTQPLLSILIISSIIQTTARKSAGSPCNFSYPYLTSFPARCWICLHHQMQHRPGCVLCQKKAFNERTAPPNSIHNFYSRTVLHRLPPYRSYLLFFSLAQHIWVLQCQPKPIPWKYGPRKAPLHRHGRRKEDQRLHGRGA